LGLRNISLTFIALPNLNLRNMENPAGQQPPKTWLVESILVTILCCLPFGIAGIVNASSVESRFRSGDIEGAKRASEQAGKWTKWGFFSGIIVIGLYIIFIVILGVGAGMSAFG
jgi:hypothetical protein